MVSGFMRNLMARHQDGGGADSGAVQFVQPRPRARFEADSAPSLSTNSSKNFLESGSFSQNEAAPSFASSPKRISKVSVLRSDLPVSPVESFHQESSSADRRTAVQPEPHLTDSQNTAAEPLLAEWSSRMENMLHRLRAPEQQAQSDEQKPPHQLDQQVRRNFHVDEAVKKMPEQPQIQMAEQQPISHLKSSSLRMEEILHRLNDRQVQEHIEPAGMNQHVQSVQHEYESDDSGSRRGEQPQVRIIEQRAERPSLGADKFGSRIEEIVHRLQVRPKEQTVMPAFSERIMVIEQERLPHPPEARSVLPTEDEPARQISRPASSPLSSRSAGLLELPGWLNGLQAELQNLREGASAAPQTQPEPVINVTIGRVEVRAVQATTAQRAQRSPKPSGIMSLDEYLKQRESRG